MNKIIIYDFDGTITPFSMPKYEIIHKCNLNDEQLYNMIYDYMKKNKTNIHVAFYNVFLELMVKYNLDITLDNICFGADRIKLNQGVLEYFQKYMNYKHYVVTSGLKDYIFKTKIGSYIEDVYGVEIDYNNKKVVKLLTDNDKVVAIKDIIQKNKCDGSDIIYFGDGLTDIPAFLYVHKVGGKCIFVNSQNNNNINYEFIDLVVDPNYLENSDIDKFISSCL